MELAVLIRFINIQQRFSCLIFFNSLKIHFQPFEEQQIIIPLLMILKEIHQNRMYFVQLQRIKFMTLSFPWAHCHG